MFFQIYSEFFRGSHAARQRLGPAAGPVITVFVIIQTFCFRRLCGAFFSWAKEIVIFNPSGALTIFGLLLHTLTLFMSDLFLAA